MDGRAYRDLDDAREQIDVFIEVVHNRQRLPLALAYRPPVVCEDRGKSPLFLLHAVDTAVIG